jgi:hypothetical protein
VFYFRFNRSVFPHAEVSTEVRQRVLGHPGASFFCLKPQNTLLSSIMASLPDSLSRPVGRPCTICTHPDRDTIDAALTDRKEPFLTIAEKFGLSNTSLQRHASEHLPARLLRNADALAQKREEEFVQLTIASSRKRLEHLQEMLDGLMTIKARRSAKAHEDAPGSETGLLIVRKTAIHGLDGKTYEHVIESEVDTALINEVRALHRAAAMETGEYLSQTGKGAFGVGETGRGPLVVVLSSGLHPLPATDRPDEARHRITDPRRRVAKTAAEVEGSAAIPLELVDVEQTPAWVEDDEDTREG